MKKYRAKIVQNMSLLLLLSMTVIFIHSELSVLQGEPEELHAQHDFCNLVSKTLQPAHNLLLAFDHGEEVQTIIEVFHFHERSKCSIDFPTPLYPKETSLILLFSTLLI